MSWRCDLYKKEEAKMNSRRYDVEEGGVDKEEVAESLLSKLKKWVEQVV
jgi:hypothetical protein